MHPLQERLLTLHRVRNLSTLSYREIARQLSDIAPVHPFKVKYHLDQLINAGALKPEDRPISVSPRKIAEVARTKETYLVRIPLMGSANAGRATIFAEDRIETYLKVSSKILVSKNYKDLIALRVKGSSMNKAEIPGGKIEDGNFVIVDKRKVTPRNREIVVTNSEGLVNIKRISFDPENRIITLTSDSTEDHEPIYLSADDNVDAFIEGTVTQVLKSGAKSNSESA